jgi:hypothetical protein
MRRRRCSLARSGDQTVSCDSPEWAMELDWTYWAVICACAGSGRCPEREDGQEENPAG